MTSLLAIDERLPEHAEAAGLSPDLRLTSWKRIGMLEWLLDGQAGQFPLSPGQAFAEFWGPWWPRADRGAQTPYCYFETSCGGKTRKWKRTRGGRSQTFWAHEIECISYALVYPGNASPTGSAVARVRTTLVCELELGDVMDGILVIDDGPQWSRPTSISQKPGDTVEIRRPFEKEVLVPGRLADAKPLTLELFKIIEPTSGVVLEVVDGPTKKSIELSRYRDRLRLPSRRFVVEYTQVSEAKAAQASQIADGGLVWDRGVYIEFGHSEWTPESNTLLPSGDGVGNGLY